MHVTGHSIKMCRTDGGEDGYARALKILRERFGCSYNVCNSIIEKLKHGPDVCTPIELRTFSDKLANAKVTLKKNNMYNEIDTQNNIVEICHVSRVLCVLRVTNCIQYTSYKFRGMLINERCDYVNTNKLCTLCPANDHSVSQYRSTYICRVNNCGEKHSSALHVYNSQPSTMVNQCAQSCDKSNILMPTVPVVVDGTYHTFALLDSGSSTTFCSKRLMNELKLQGSKTTYELQTLHGSKKQCTEVVSLHMSSTDGLKCLDMNNVVVVDDIPVERSHLPDLSNYHHLKDLTFL